MSKPVFNIEALSLFEAEKLKQDIFYYSMYQNGFSYDELKSSGWLNHDYSKKKLLDVMDNQSSFIPHFAKDGEVAIILNTGSYAPVHDGHIMMLNNVESHLKELGLIKNSIKILSPSHDKYVLTKSEDIKIWNINKRLRFLYNLVDKYKDEKLMVDIWEGVYCDYPVNFTDVILKYVRDLEKQNIKYKIFYVFGSDNEQFLYPFDSLPNEYKDKFFGVCVKRDGYPTHINSQGENIIYVDNHNYSFLKSRDLRKEKVYTEDVFVQSFYSYGGFYAVRKDNLSALSSWLGKAYDDRKQSLISAYDEFHDSLKNTIHKYLKVEVLSIDLEVQRKILSSVLKNKKSLNLDLATNRDSSINQLPLSKGRLFNPASRQNKPIKMIERNDLGVFNIQIPPGKYWFVDDDIASGQTFALIQDELSKIGVVFEDKLNLTESYCNMIGKEYSLFDIVDTKDFLLGTYSGGLICEYFGSGVRVPYFANYVNLYSRASIPHSVICDFNLDILKLNRDFFRKNNFLTVDDLEKNTEEQNILDVLRLNFDVSKTMPIVEIIEQMIEKAKS